MPTHIALLRAINVGGTGKLPMAELRALCEQLGFAKVRTYIQSGNVVFESRKSAKAVKPELEAALSKRLGKPNRVILRSSAELREIVERSPFADEGTGRNLNTLRTLIALADG